MATNLMTYGTLILAVSMEVLGTSLLPQTKQFTRLLPTLGMLLCYAGAFYFLSHALKTLPVGIAYAIWSGFGIVLISGIGWIWLKQALDLPAVIGIGLILSGVLVINLFSSATPH
ncbi:QacE family quaternary ammonium compound efflux SMR transporter [Pseudogemmobacter sp. CC-YST710]|uniref:QacE family quaternary ammonium compound efflux SMR transporter n=2 Tax=Pseudogemmobacter faecipullorum TaxID=2755041 RepID=A0ABS8CRV0_9RHOB|nr:SMR family transporter [Pseudogemmobacter faecipullorum]MCB5411898.1 QacE family quaternary ammonium compound efflux SMR transporter [Pseudogemmobacter faecipullorum]